AAALARLGQDAALWPVLKHSADPTARSYLVQRLQPLGVEAGLLAERLLAEPDASARRGAPRGAGGGGRGAAAGGPGGPPAGERAEAAAGEAAALVPRGPRPRRARGRRLAAAPRSGGAAAAPARLGPGPGAGEDRPGAGEAGAAARTALVRQQDGHHDDGHA